MTEGMEKRKEGHEAIFARHSKAQYLTDVRISASETPRAPIEKEDQVTPDLSEAGVELAERSAREFFSTLDKDRDKIFLASSHMARALETAALYAKVAREMGFTIIRPEHVRGKLAEHIGGGDVRVVRELSLRPEDSLAGQIFNPDSHMPKINWDAVQNLQNGAQLKARWDEAHARIVADDQGSWGSNYFKHSKMMKEEFPELDIGSAEHTYNEQFHNIVRLAEWGIEKAREKDPDGSVKILGFGHENYFGHGLDKYFQDHTLPNCEYVAFNLADNDTITIERKGVVKTMDENFRKLHEFETREKRDRKEATDI